MDSLFTILTIIAGLAVIGPVLARLVVAYQKGVSEISSLELLTRHAIDEGQQAIEQTAVLENELTGLTRERDELQAQIKPLEDSVSPEALARRERVYMASDRYSQWDEEFIVRIVNNTMDRKTFHSSAVDSWVAGRKHVFWGVNEPEVRASVEARFPAALGYEIISVEVARDRLVRNKTAADLDQPLADIVPTE